MKPAPFDYVRCANVAEAIAALAGEEGAKVIAGGQSLVPLMAMRLARPTLLVDVNDVGLDGITVEGDVVRVGACTRHRRLERDPVIARAAPLLREAAGLIGYPAIRTRGTIGGSLAHADPVAELPTVLLAAGGSVVVRSAAGTRVIEAADLFTGFLGTTLEHEEIIEDVLLPVAGPRHGSSFCEWSPREGDFATAGVALAIERDDDGRCRALGAAACGIASVPLDCSTLMASALGETSASGAVLRQIARVMRAELGGDADRADLVGLLAARAVHRAFARSDVPGEAAA
ncbi:MAG: aerobic carbon-monoxide dehydrogenase medium subunit [Actinomycetota bacterium]|nr:aerobic carbon-monoxide dehydrogenase medium subunit [Actinomycetota bacterium]